MTMKDKLTSIRLPIEIEIEIDRLAKIKDTNKSKLIRELIMLGIKEIKLEMALALYVKGRVSLWKAATLAEISLWGMMEIVKQRKIPIQYGEKELKEDLKALRE